MNDLRLLGRQAAENRASNYTNVGNGNSAAVSFIAGEIETALKYPAKLIPLQKMCRVSLFPIFSKADKDRELAAAAFVAGAYEWLAENPD